MSFVHIPHNSRELMNSHYNWFVDFSESRGLKDNEWFMSHESVAKIKRLPSWNVDKQRGKLILVTAMTPTSHGEGKTTTAIALNDALNTIGQSSIATLRQPSMGPVFGKKGGATGGGKASIVPKDIIDLGLTGDFFAIESANNLIAALIDNHCYYNLSPSLQFHDTGSFPRCIDMNDRLLRQLESAQGIRNFVITAATELMAIVSLSKNFKDLKSKLANIIIGQDSQGKFISAGQLNFHKAAAVLLRDAMYPNLVQSEAGHPVFLHTGPFANIAQGTSSINSTALAMELSDYVVTEAGFGAELGAEKFFNIKCRKGNLDVAATVIVATSRAILEHGGLENLLVHVENCKSFGPEVVVAINKFPNDDINSLTEIIAELKVHNIQARVCDSFEKGTQGALELAQLVHQIANPCKIHYSYDLEDSVIEKVNKIATKIYRAKNVEWAPEAMIKMQKLEDAGLGNYAICMAKTPLSLSDDSQLKGVPKGHSIHIRDVLIQAGAGFIVLLTGSVQLLPGLPLSPRALRLDLTDQGEILWNS